MRVLITGSRTWTDWSVIVEEILALPDGALIIHGDCPDGADRIADRIARGCDLDVDPHPAQWRQYGRRAAYVRNAEMVGLDPDLCLAFNRNNSPGTSMTVALAKARGLAVKEMPWPTAA